MSVFHDEVEIEDFEYDEETETYYFPCPCGDRFAITKEDLENGEEVATCPSCSLIVRVIYDKVSVTSRFTFTEKTWSLVARRGGVRTSSLVVRANVCPAGSVVGSPAAFGFRGHTGLNPLSSCSISD
uniref:Diphthamide biosynthesis protein 3 n=1 Tax=Scleropages formosus TaxID=113540 RepID=A0A8C9VP56_SCLFO